VVAWDSALGHRGGGDPEGIQRWQLGVGEEEISRSWGGGPKGASVVRSCWRQRISGGD
jgi:hypothetical protein